MSYQKFLVDNPICSRRFHCTFDDQGPKVNDIKLECPHCGKTFLELSNHPEVTLARDENLTKTTTLSRKLMRECGYKDPFVRPVDVK